MLPSLSLNHAPRSVSLNFAMPFSVLRPGKSYSSKVTPRARRSFIVLSRYALFALFEVEVLEADLDDRRRRQRQKRAHQTRQTSTDQQRHDHRSRAHLDRLLHHARRDQIVLDLLVHDEVDDHEYQLRETGEDRDDS